MCRNGLPECVGRNGWVGSRIVWMTGKIGMINYVWVCMYAPVCEKGVKNQVKMDKFWEDLAQLLKSLKM